MIPVPFEKSDDCDCSRDDPTRAYAEKEVANGSPIGQRIAPPMKNQDGDGSAN